MFQEQPCQHSHVHTQAQLVWGQGVCVCVLGGGGGGGSVSHRIRVAEDSPLQYSSAYEQCASKALNKSIYTHIKIVRLDIIVIIYRCVCAVRLLADGWDNLQRKDGRYCLQAVCVHGT